MKALIFNSGLGKRMGDFTMSNHKSMALLQNGETIFERQLRILHQQGIKNVIITTGPFKEQLYEICSKDYFKDIQFQFVENKLYDKTNYIYSMYLAKEYLDDDIIMLHGDLVFNNRLLEKVLKDKRENLGMVNKNKALPEKDFKAKVVDNRIRKVAIDIFDEDCYAFQPLYKLSNSVLQCWLAKIDEFVSDGNTLVYAENALNCLLDTLKIDVFDYSEDYVDEIDNLEDQKRVSSEIRQFDFDEQLIYETSGSIVRIKEILENHNIRRPMLVCDESFEKLHANSLIKEIEYEFTIFNKFTANPRYEDICAGVSLFIEKKCDFLISIGGGSTIDTAKNIKLFSQLDQNEVFLKQEYKYSPIKHLAIPTTAGTGSESTRFSVLYYEGEKQSVAHDCILPEYVILDSDFLKTLPLFQKKCTVMDALCQCFEAIWSVNTNKICQEYAMAGAKLILNNLEAYINGDTDSYTSIMKGANLSGKAINISQTTAAHAMSYKMSSLYNIPHGYAVALCFPHVWEYIVKNMASDTTGIEKPDVAKALDMLNKLFETDSYLKSIEKYNEIMEFLGLDKPALAELEEIDILTASVNVERLGNNPVIPDKKDIREMYRNILVGV